MNKDANHSGEPDNGAFWFWLCISIFWMLLSCSRTQYVPVKEIRIDSVSIMDTVFQEQLVPYRDSTVTKDTVSYLSNPYAYSWARWDSGRLHHSLAIRPQTTIQVKVPYFINRYIYRSEPRTVEVEKKLTRWQRIKLEAGGYAVGALFLLFAMIIVRWIRNKGRR